MKHNMKRRQFLASASVGTFGVLLTGHRAFSQAATTVANNKLNLGVIGITGRGGENLMGVSGENIAAICDVDDRNLTKVAQRFPDAKQFTDFREMLDKAKLDAVVVSTPDHCHAVASVMAMQKGLHVYCEKPLARTVSEARAITEAARKYKRITQMGIQIHSGNNYRRVVELVQSGAIGPVREVHVWVQVVYGGKELPTETPPCPPEVHYDLWLGPLEPVPYNAAYLPFNWRNWWAFGGGTMSDFGCHYMDLPHWALELSHPKSVEKLDGPPLDPVSVPPWSIVRYEHPARGEKPPVTLTWYHGKGQHPKMLTAEQYQQWKSGVLFIGEKGQIISNYANHELWPEAQFREFKRPQPFIKNVASHHRDWIEAIKNGGKATCHFDYSGPLSETALLGNVAFRTGKKLEWDWKKLVATNCPEASQYVQHKYRKGWEGALT